MHLNMLCGKVYLSQYQDNQPLIQDFFKRATEAAEQGHRMVPLNAPTEEIEKLMLIRLTELGYKRDCMCDEKTHRCVTCASWV